MNATLTLAECVRATSMVGNDQQFGLIVLAGLAIIFFVFFMCYYVDYRKAMKFLYRKKLLQAFEEWREERRID